MTSGYFAVEPPPPVSAGWRTFTDLAADHRVLDERIAATAAALGTNELRVAASIDFQGIAARVLSPALGTAVATATVPMLDPTRVWWRPARPGPMRLAWDDDQRQPASAGALLAGVVQPVLAPAIVAYRDRAHVSPKVLWGNVASALTGAAAMLGAGQHLVAELLRLGDLAGTARRPPPHFSRNSCCLYYRLPGGGTCGDCVLIDTVRNPI